MSDHLELPCIVASRGRNPDNPKSRETGVETEQQLEINTEGTSNCLTTIQKDNWVIEPCVLTKERTEFGKQVRKNYEAGKVNLKRAEMTKYTPRKDGCSGTITTVQKDNYVVECDNMTDANGAKHQQDLVNDSDGVSATLVAGSHLNADTYTKMVVDVDNHKYPFRIRKLTPKECWRLQGFDDEDIDKCIASGVSSSQLYKQAGNSIAVNCLCAIFQNLLGTPCDSMPAVDVESRLF